MNIIMAVIGLVGLKRAPECIKMHHFEGENAKIFLERGTAPFPDPTPRTHSRRRLRTPRPHFWIRAWFAQCSMQAGSMGPLMVLLQIS